MSAFEELIKKYIKKNCEDLLQALRSSHNSINGIKLEEASEEL